MAIVSDFTHIVGDESIVIGDNSNPLGFTKNFSTGGRDGGGKAFISFMIKGLTVADQDAKVLLNDVEIGKLRRNKDGNKNHWQTQSVSLHASNLKSSGNNVLRVNPVTYSGGGDDDFDDFAISNVICHFHQNV